VQLDVQLGAGQLQLVSDGQIPAVVGKIGVPSGPHLTGHRVQTHPVDGGVCPHILWGPDHDGARAVGLTNYL